MKDGVCFGSVEDVGDRGWEVISKHGGSGDGHGSRGGGGRVERDGVLDEGGELVLDFVGTYGGTEGAHLDVDVVPGSGRCLEVVTLAARLHVDGDVVQRRGAHGVHGLQKKVVGMGTRLQGG